MNDLIIKSDNHWLIDPQAVSVIAEYTVAIKAAEEKLKELKCRIQEEMKAKNIIDLEANEGGVSISVKYITGSDEFPFNSKQFQKDYPTLYDKYCEKRRRKDSIRVTVK